MAECEAAAAQPQQLSQAILRDANVERPQLPSIYVQQHGASSGVVAAAGLVHVLRGAPDQLPLAHGLLRQISGNSEAIELLSKASVDAAAPVQGQLKRLVALVTHTPPHAPASNKRKRDAAWELQLQIAAEDWLEAASSAELLASSATRSCRSVQLVWKALFGALDARRERESQRLVQVLTTMGEEHASVWGQLLCSPHQLSSTPSAADCKQLQGELLARVLLQLLLQGHMGETLTTIEGLLLPADAAVAKHAMMVAAVLDASKDNQLQQLTSALQQLCDHVTVAQSDGGWVLHISVGALLSGSSPLLLDVLLGLVTVTGPVVLPQSEVDWSNGSAVPSAALGLKESGQLQGCQQVAALLLQLCLGRLVELQPDKTCWILATAQLHLYHASFKEAFQSLLRTAALQSNMFADTATLLNSGMIRQLLQCTVALQMHSATVALSQWSTSELPRTLKMLQELHVQQLDNRLLCFVWQIPLLEQLLNAAVRSNAHGTAAAVMERLRDPTMNQWNSSKILQAAQTSCWSGLLRELFDQMTKM